MAAHGAAKARKATAGRTAVGKQSSAWGYDVDEWRPCRRTVPLACCAAAVGGEVGTWEVMNQGIVWLGLVTGLLGRLGCIAEYWAIEIFRVNWVIRVPGVCTRITRNNFGFLEVLPEIGFGYFGFG